jgi:asparagine synthase (glutamine-hydrolysing)
MSGIVGILFKDGRPVYRSHVQRMVSTILHRGPDDSGIWCEGSVGLGHCMHRTTPESQRERQPLVDRTGNLVLTADARIDNRDGLISALDIDGPPSEITDSQIILSAYERWGKLCPEKLLGDFAFALWDRRQKTLFCARDPMGVRPFFYFSSDRILVVASEIKALLCLPQVPIQLNEIKVAMFMIRLFDEEDLTFYKDIYRLPAATCMVGGQRTETRKYWSLDPQMGLRLDSNEEYFEAFRDIFSEAVRCRLRRNTHVGCLLSGGLDSSSICCTTRRIFGINNPEPLHTFSVVFPGLPEDERKWADESEYIDAVLKLGGFKPHYIRADLMGPLSDIGCEFLKGDEPVYDLQLYHFVAAMSSAKYSGICSLLSGWGGDQTISYGWEYFPELMKWGRFLRLLSESRKATERSHLSLRKFILQTALKPLLPARALSAWRLLRGHSSPSPFRLHAAKSSLLEEHNLGFRMNRCENRYGYTKFARKTHWLQLTDPLIPTAVENMTNVGCSFGVDIRYPFLDRRLLEFCLSIPASKKFSEGWSRWILRQAMDGELPRSIQWRRTKGDMLPNFRRNLALFDKPILEEVLLGHSHYINNFYDNEVLSNSLEKYLKDPIGEKDEDVLFALFSATALGIWLEGFETAKKNRRQDLSQSS